MSDTVTTKTEGYQEDENFVPNPTDQLGTLDTSETGGPANNSIREVSKVFEVADVENAKAAARALDPDDPTPESLVVLPDEDVDRDAVIDRVRKRADEVEPVSLADHTTPAEREAGEEKDGADDPTSDDQGAAQDASVRADATPGATPPSSDTKDGDQSKTTARKTTAAGNKGKGDDDSKKS